MSTWDMRRILGSMTEEKIDIVSKAHAAKLCGVTVRTIKRWADAGRIRVQRDPLNGRPYYVLEDLENIINRSG